MARQMLLTPALLLVTVGNLMSTLTAEQVGESKPKTGFELQQGYRRERFDFLAGSKQGRSGMRDKFHSKHIDVHSSRLLFKGVNDNGMFLQAALGYGNILRGRADFTDHMRHHGQSVTTRTGFHTSRDYTMDLGLFLGKEYHMEKGFNLAPRIGYSFYRQKFHFKNAVLKTAHDKKLHGYHASYKADWYSPQLGLRAEKGLSKNVSVFADYSFLWPLKYRGTGSANKRALDSFNFHNKDKQWRSWGHIGVIGAKLGLSSNWSLNLEYELSKFFARKGSQRVGHDSQMLHKAHRSASEIRLALCYNF